MQPSPSHTPQLHVILHHPDQRQLEMLSQAMQTFNAQFKSASSWSEVAQERLSLGGVWVLFDLGAETLQAIKQLRGSQAQAFWGILILGQSPPSAQQSLITAGADAYLSYPFDLPTLKKQLLEISAQRAPVSNFQVLPKAFASSLDHVWSRFEELSYYELLELPLTTTAHEVQARFHQRSLLLHPDRHRALKQQCPPVYDRVNIIYKRLLESYRILTDPLQRSLYDAGLGRGSKRWGSRNEQSRREIREMSSQTETHLLLAQALSARSRGLLKVAERLSERALSLEPDNPALQKVNRGYRKLISLARRDPEIDAILEQQVPSEGGI